MKINHPSTFPELLSRYSPSSLESMRHIRHPYPYIYVIATASVVHCQSIVQVSSCQLVLNLLLPRYLEKWVSYKLEIPVSK